MHSENATDGRETEQGAAIPRRRAAGARPKSDEVPRELVGGEHDGRAAPRKEEVPARAARGVPRHERRKCSQRGEQHVVDRIGGERARPVRGA